MTREALRAFDYVLVVLVNLTILSGTAYLVGWQRWSPWWFAFSVVVLNRPSKDRQFDPDEPSKEP